MNVVGDTLTAYYNLIKNNGLTVYKITVPETETGNYVWLYPEGGNEENTKSSKNDNVTIRISVVTKYKNDADQTACEDADSTINNLIIPSAGSHGLTEPSGLQFLNVRRENYQYLIESTPNGVYYRKESRYVQRVHQI